jgi:beta-glucosidase
MTQIAERQLTEDRIDKLLEQMTLEEKVGQLTLANGGGGHIPDWLDEGVRRGRTGAVLNEVDLDMVNELQRRATEETRLGIPLLFGRDVIHGFRTVFPIPLGQAATWNPEIVERGARVAALEAARCGINWTFAPMLDIGRDPRWGRVAETLGEDPHLTSVLGAAMVRGFQGRDLDAEGSIAACAKHFAGYGASESGKDYNTTNIPENELRNVHLRPFKAALDAGVCSLMTSFSDLDGLPASANEFLLDQVLRREWDFDGFVVSDWDSISQLQIHGLTQNDRESAFEAARAGVDMEMASTTYAHHLPQLVTEGRISEAKIDGMVRNILRIKLRLGLFQRPYVDAGNFPAWGNPKHLADAREAARQSIVMLKNRDQTLPLKPTELRSLAVIGPMADEPYEQLGTWIFDGDPALSQTPLHAIREALRDQVDVRHARGLHTTRSGSREGFEEALHLARASDAVVMVVGEESILSGEAHCRGDITLPGAQRALVEDIASVGKPVILVIMAGRALALDSLPESVDAILYAWHPGTMGGPAIADLLTGISSPSGRLPVSLPRIGGQIPIYYAHKNTGRPPTPETFIHIDEIDAGAPQLSIGNTSFHLDVHPSPAYPFGFGLTYGDVQYRAVSCPNPQVSIGSSLEVIVELVNQGSCRVEEVVQVYVRDLVGSVTRPVRELVAFKRVPLDGGEVRHLRFDIDTDALAFFGRDMKRKAEPGQFHLWVGGNASATLQAEFELLP